MIRVAGAGWRKLAGACLLSAIVSPAAGCLRTDAQRNIDLRGEDWKIRFEDSLRFRSPEYADQRWAAISVPSNWTDARSHAGIAWYRKRIVLTEDAVAPQRDLGLYIENLVDSDECYWNGERIGGMGNVTRYRAHAYGRPRSYLIPAEHLRRGPNILAIRVRGYFYHVAGIRSGEIYLDDPLSIEARLVLREQLRLIVALGLLTLGLGFLLSCVYSRARSVRAYFALGAASAGWVEFWNTPLAYEWMEGARQNVAPEFFPATGDAFLFVKAMQFGGSYVLGIAALAFWTAYLRLRSTPLHVVYYAFTLLVLSACVISEDLILWNDLFRYWFLATLPALLTVLILLALQVRRGAAHQRWLVLAFVLMAITATHDWLHQNGHIVSVRLFAAGFVSYHAIVALVLVRDFRRQTGHSNAEFQRLWSLRTANHRLLEELARELGPRVARLAELTFRLTESDRSRQARATPQMRSSDNLRAYESIQAESAASLSALAGLEGPGTSETRPGAAAAAGAESREKPEQTPEES